MLPVQGRHFVQDRTIPVVPGRGHGRPRCSTYFVCGFSGNALPVIGVGVISTLASPTAASLASAPPISLFVLVALFFGIKYPP
jgi:hypothetical protein